MLGVRGQVATEIGGAAVLEPDRAVSPHTLATATFDADETALADRTASSAVVEIRAEIDADAVAGVGPICRADTTAIDAGRSRRACQLTDTAIADIGLGVDADAPAAGETRLARLLARGSRPGRRSWAGCRSSARSRPASSRRRMPIAEIAGEWAGEIPINRARAAVQWLLCRPDQDKGQPLLDGLEIGSQIEGTAGRLANNRYLRPTVEK
jgi:hypothetical protein